MTTMTQPSLNHLRQHRFLMGARPGASDFAVYGQLTQLAHFDPTPMALAVSLAVLFLALLALSPMLEPVLLVKRLNRHRQHNSKLFPLLTNHLAKPLACIDFSWPLTALSAMPLTCLTSPPLR